MDNMVIAIGVISAIVIFGIIGSIIKMYRKVSQGSALVRTGMGGSKVSFSGIMVVPVLHKMELMDISVKRIEINRSGKDGLICKDNMRADIKVAFFVRVNKTVDDVLKVAQSIGCGRASDPQAMIELFDAKFSEALKTAGKRFEFTDLYVEREQFKSEILQIIGTDLNGYVLDDCAIDYLEQTPLEFLNPSNILDSQGIKKITEITAKEKIFANQIQREKEKTITQQDVEAQEAILELNKQLAETEERQKREIGIIKAREEAERLKIEEEERLKAERARIASDEEIAIAEENKQRQVLVALKSKERTDAVETERVDREKLLEQNEKERVVELARIEKEKALEEERRNIQEVIRERVAVEKDVVTEEERIKDTRILAEANREKEATVIRAEMSAKEIRVKEIAIAEAQKESAKQLSEKQLIEAKAELESSKLEADARKVKAEAKAAEEAAIGMSEAQVMEAKADAIEKQGEAEAQIILRKAESESKMIEMTAFAEAKGKEANAAAEQKQGEVEAAVLAKKMNAEAEGIREKAEAMKEFDGVGREHEEFKLKLNMQKDIELARINIQKDIAHDQANVLSEALKASKIDIVGGETMFFDKIVGSVTQGKSIDRLVSNSHVLTDVKETFFNGDAEHFTTKLQELVGRFGMSSDDLKNITVSALLGKLILNETDQGTKSFLHQLNQLAESKGVSGTLASDWLSTLK